jgi:hypothetical protein
VSLEVESLDALVHGSISIATPGPPDDGPVVRTGHRFEMASRPDDDWLRWKPLAVIGHTYLPPGASSPRPLRAKIAWTQGTIFRGRRLRQGWVLQTTAGLLGPADLLRAGAKARDDSAQLEIAGRIVPLDTGVAWSEGGLVLLDIQVGNSVWPEERHRRPGGPEDCLAIADPNAEPLPLAAARLIGDAVVGWRVDPAVSISGSWHGASVVARSDGQLVGVLLVEEEVTRIALMPQE